MKSITTRASSSPHSSGGSGRHRILIGERGEERSLELPQGVPGHAVRCRCGVSGLVGTSIGNWRAPACSDRRGTARHRLRRSRREIGRASGVHGLAIEAAERCSPDWDRSACEGTLMNVLLITTDQQRADTLGCAGSPLGATPRLDAFAAQGTRFCEGAHATRAVPTGAGDDTYGHLPVDARRHVQRDRPARRCRSAIVADVARWGRPSHRAVRQGALRDDVPVPVDRPNRVGRRFRARPRRLARSVLWVRAPGDDDLRAQPAHCGSDGSVELGVRPAAVRPALCALPVP